MRLKTRLLFLLPVFAHASSFGNALELKRNSVNGSCAGGPEHCSQAAPIELPENLTQEQVRDLVARLPDDQVRELIIRELDKDALAADQATDATAYFEQLNMGINSAS